MAKVGANGAISEVLVRNLVPWGERKPCTLTRTVVGRTMAAVWGQKRDLGLIVGLLMWFFVDAAKYPKVVEAGKIMFTLGLLVFLLIWHGKLAFGFSG